MPFVGAAPQLPGLLPSPVFLGSEVRSQFGSPFLLSFGWEAKPADAEPGKPAPGTTPGFRHVSPDRPEAQVLAVAEPVGTRRGNGQRHPRPEHGQQYDWRRRLRGTWQHRRPPRPLRLHLGP